MYSSSTLRLIIQEIVNCGAAKEIYIPPSIVLPIQQVGIYCNNLIPEDYKGNYGSYFPPMNFYFILQSTTLSDNSTDFTSFCCDSKMFTVITTKDQSGGIYNNYSTGGQEFMAILNKPRPRATPSDSVCLLPYIPGTCAITITYVTRKHIRYITSTVVY